MGDAKLQAWIAKELGRLLKLTDADSYLEELASYMLQIESQADMEEYITDLLGVNHRKGSLVDVFREQLLRRWRPAAKTVEEPAGLQGYRKKDTEEVLYAPKTAESNASSKQEKRKQRQEKKAAGATTNGSRQSPATTNGSRQSPATAVKENRAPPTGETRKTVMSLSSSSAPPGFSKPIVPTSKASGRRHKFVPMTTAQTAALQVPGRHTCECQALRHNLVNNCLKCGRIVCEQEGAGPCLFCGELVCTAADQEALARDSKRSAKLREKLMAVPGGGALSQMSEKVRHHMAAMDRGSTMDTPDDTTSSSPSLQRATQLKDRLLDYDRTSVQRTKVIDDESDYFTAETNSWMNADDRKVLQARADELHEQRHTSRRDRKVTLDIAGRRVVEDEDWKMKHSDALYGGEDKVLQDLEQQWKSKRAALVKDVTGGSQGRPNGSCAVSSIAHPSLEKQFTFVAGDEEGRTNQQAPTPSGNAEMAKGSVAGRRIRIQDKELLEMRDEGLCLSMHQPWASLLVTGIKRDEGRSWYTAHRGRLWIAAGAKPLDQADLSAIKCFYANQPHTSDLEFPTEYPTGCLLGCVDVEDCLSQEDYRTKFPKGESESPYVFVCSNPQDLLIKFPVKGKHKIWKLERDMHKAAQRCLS